MLDQITIAVCGLTSVYLSQDRDPRRQRWACVAGLLAQPAWMWSSWQADQFGIFALSFVYAAGWLRGFWNFWIQPRVGQ